MTRRALLMSLFCLCLSVSSFENSVWAQPPQGSGKAESLERKIQAMEKTVAGLEDANAMLVENLAECAQENEALRHELKTGKELQSVTEEKARLVENLRKMLSTNSELDFLRVLDTDHLKMLQEIIGKRIGVADFTDH